MAFGIRYEAQFANVDQWGIIDVQILEDGYLGQPYEMTLTGNPCSIVVNEVERFDPILSTGCKINILNTIEDGNFQYKWMFARSPRDFIVRIIQNNIILFEGYLITELYEEEFTDPPYDVTLSATCGLSRLDQFDIGLLNLNPRESLITVIAQILQQTGFDYPIQVNCELFEKSHNKDVTGTLFDQTFIDTIAFISDRNEWLNCKETLESLLKPFNCRIYQESHVEFSDSWTTNAFNNDNTIVEIYGPFDAENDFPIGTEVVLTTTTGDHIRTVINMTIEGVDVDKKVIITLDQSSPGQSIRIKAYLTNTTVWRIERIVDLYDETDNKINFVDYTSLGVLNGYGERTRILNTMYDVNSNIENFNLKFKSGYKRMVINQELIPNTTAIAVCEIENSVIRPDDTILSPDIFDWQHHTSYEFDLDPATWNCNYWRVFARPTPIVNWKLGRLTGLRTRTRFYYNGTDEDSLKVGITVRPSNIDIDQRENENYNMLITVYLEPVDFTIAPIGSSYGYVKESTPTTGDYSFIWNADFELDQGLIHSEYMILQRRNMDVPKGELDMKFDWEVKLQDLNLPTTTNPAGHEYRVMVKIGVLSYGDDLDNDDLDNAVVSDWASYSKFEVKFEIGDTDDNVIEAEINTNFTDELEVDLQFGDIPNMNYKNGFWINDFAITSRWGERNQDVSEYVYLQNKMALDAFQTYSEGRHYLSGALYRKEYTALSYMFEDKYLQRDDGNGLANMPFYISGFDHDLYYNIFNITLNEFVKNAGVELI